MQVRNKLTQNLASILAVAALMLGASLSAHADTQEIFNLTIPNTGLSSSPGPYAVATFTLNGTGGINVTVQGDQVGSNPFDYLFFGTGAFAFNATSGLTLTMSAASAAAGYTATGSTHDDGFGTFTYGIDGPSGGPSTAISTISFTITKAGGFTSVSQLGIFSTISSNCPSGCAMAAQIAPYAGAVNTGYAGFGSPGIPTPEPASLTLLGAGLVGLGTFARRKVGK